MGELTPDQLRRIEYAVKATYGTAESLDLLEALRRASYPTPEGNEERSEHD